MRPPRLRFPSGSSTLQPWTCDPDGTRTRVLHREKVARLPLLYGAMLVASVGIPPRFSVVGGTSTTSTIFRHPYLPDDSGSRLPPRIISPQVSYLSAILGGSRTPTFCSTGRRVHLYTIGPSGRFLPGALPRPEQYAPRNRCVQVGVTDGTRTRDFLNHNQAFYRLNYSQRRKDRI